MTVLRIVANLATKEIAESTHFYKDLLGLKIVMDLGWIITYSSGESMQTRLSVATEGGSGTPVPDLSIEVDNVNDVYKRACAANYNIVYDITDEPWGVRRFYVSDPFGKTVNILQHI